MGGLGNSERGSDAFRRPGKSLHHEEHELEKKPNILLIMSDQHRGDALGCAGHPTLLTPALDTLAHRGVRFERAMSTCPVCIPARRSLLSGQFPPTHGLVGMVDGIPWNPAATLPGELKKGGYQTFLVGRDMHQFPRRKRFGYDHMVHTGDVHPDDVTGPLPGHGEDPSWSHGLDANGWTARPWQLSDDLHPSHRTVDAALHFLKRRDPDCPFFLTVSFAAPHPPLYPPAFYFDRYLRTKGPRPVIGSWADAPANGGLGLPIDDHRCDLRGEALLSCQAGYWGSINHMDDQIHRLLNPHTGLDLETRKNTVIVYTSDHGEMLGDHYRFRKCSPFEGSSRIPLILEAPPSLGLQRNAVKDIPVCLEDLMPTFLDIAGLPIPPSVEGKSFLDLARGDSAGWKRDCLHGECVREPDDSWHLVTDGRFKYIWFPDSGREMLFDLPSDPGETTDLMGLGKWKGEAERMKAHMIRELQGRPEGFVVDGQLVAERPLRQVLEKTLP